MKIDNYKHAENFIKSRKKHGIKPGLNRMKSMIFEIDYKNKCKIIHVTGTNGKGSTTAYIEAGLLTTNNNIGTFTSPSLTDLTGHFTMNDQAMSEAEFVAYLNKLLPIIKKLDSDDNHPSEFEILTIIAVLYFEDKANIAVVETGMGGLLDTTNVLRPIISVITSISFDHQAFLGETLAEITKHKAGIIKEKVPVVLGNVTEESLEIVKQTATKQSAKLFRLGNEFTVTKTDATYKFIEKETGVRQSFTLKNKGIYQSENAALALEVLLIINGLDIELDLVECTAAIEKRLISNRYELINENPKIIIDGAHNVASMQALLATVKQDREASEKHLIISAFKDKPLEEMINLAKGNFKTITVTTFEHARAYSKEALEALELPAITEADWSQLLDEIIQEKSNSSIYYIVGSVLFTNTVKKAINKNK